MRTAANVRQEKQRHPERFCAHPTCLWRTVTKAGPSPCQKHPAQSKAVPTPIDLEAFVEATLDGTIGDLPTATQDDAIAAVEFGVMARVDRPLTSHERFQIMIATVCAWNRRVGEAFDPRSAAVAHAS